MNNIVNDTLSQEELERRIDILRNQTFYIGESYFPEKPSKSVEERFKDLVGQIKKYGWPDFQYLQYGMDVKSEEECEQYVNAMEFVYRRNYLNFERNPINSCCILRNKLYFDIFARSLNIKTPHIVAYYYNHTLYSLDNRFQPITLASLLDLGDKDYFCKDMSGECGVGIFKLKVERGKFYIKNKEVSQEEVLSMMDNADYIIQDRVLQHPEMDRMYSSSINTIRLVTVRSLKDGELHVLPSILRIGANGSIVDNTSQGGIAVGFDLETGQLNKQGCYKPQFGRLTDQHPNSKIVFNDFYIPFIQQVKQEASFFHSMLKDIHSIGWDIAISPEGPVFIEGNDDWEITGPQACNGGLRKEFNEYFFE